MKALLIISIFIYWNAVSAFLQYKAAQPLSKKDAAMNAFLGPIVYVWVILPIYAVAFVIVSATFAIDKIRSQNASH